jgi:hypothetical protein
VALPPQLFEFTVSYVPRHLDRCIAVLLGFSHHNTVWRWTGLIQCVAFNSSFLSGNCFLRVTDATHVYRTRYSLDIKLKTLHPECSLCKSPSPRFRSSRVGGHVPLLIILEPKQRMEWFAVLKNIVKYVGYIVVNLLFQKENEPNISSCTHSTPHTNFDVM